VRAYNASIFLILMLLAGSLAAQEGSEITVHKNVRLIEMAIPENIPKELADKYRAFLPVFEKTLIENTSEQTSENAITFRVVPGIKEIGSAKTKRVYARITAYRKNSKNEYVGSLLLHNYATGKLVSKEEIAQFLAQQILKPLGAS